LKIWADLHGAPGSENGFDNSGRFAGESSCHGWDQNPANVERTVTILTDIAQGIVDEGLQDVVTGFGVLNEPFVDCDEGIVRQYYSNALVILRSLLGEHVSVFVGDTFRSVRFNNKFWVDSEMHHDTYLDSHPYHVFFEKGMPICRLQKSNGLVAHHEFAITFRNLPIVYQFLSFSEIFTGRAFTPRQQ
jgi:glucan 1,3-beta-glucosidase